MAQSKSSTRLTRYLRSRRLDLKVVSKITSVNDSQGATIKLQPFLKWNSDGILRGLCDRKYNIFWYLSWISQSLIHDGRLVGIKLKKRWQSESVALLFFSPLFHSNFTLWIRWVSYGRMTINLDITVEQTKYKTGMGGGERSYAC